MGNVCLLQDAAYNYLRELLLADRLEAGVIYSETQIAQALRCSRTPVKDALTRLSHAKYIDIIPSKGFMLHRLSEQDIAATFQTRVAIESFCVISAMQRRGEPEGAAAIRRLEALLAQMRAIADGSDPEAFLRLDMAFHREIVEFVPNEDFAELYEAHTYRIEKLANRSLREEGRCAETCREHTAILEAMRAGDLGACYTAVLAHNQSTYRRDLRILRAAN